MLVPERGHLQLVPSSAASSFFFSLPTGTEYLGLSQTSNKALRLLRHRFSSYQVLWLSRAQSTIAGLLNPIMYFNIIINILSYTGNSAGFCKKSLLNMTPREEMIQSLLQAPPPKSMFGAITPICGGHFILLHCSCSSSFLRGYDG